MFKKGSLAALILTMQICSPVNAAQTWSEVAGKHIKSIQSAAESSNNVIRVYFVEPLSTGCAASDTGGFVSIWNSGVFDNNWGQRVNLLEAAAAQGLTVDMGTETSTCDANYGRKWFGVRVNH